jgi:hypothetical protein
MKMTALTTPPRKVTAFQGLVLLLSLGLMALALLSASLWLGARYGQVVVIGPDEMGVADHLRPEGLETVTLDPGWHFLPALSAVRVYTLTPESVQLNGAAAVSAVDAGGHPGAYRVVVSFEIRPESLLDFDRNWRDRYRDGLVIPSTQGAVRASAAQLALSQPATSEELAAEDLRPRFAEHGLGLLKVRIELEP